MQEQPYQMRRIINAAADTIILGILSLSAALSIYTAITVYPLNPYWIELLADYSGGFVRRFLLGEILGHIPGVSPETAGLVLLTVCYVFVTVSLYAGIRRLNLPLFLRILVLLSPFGIAFYLMMPTSGEPFLLRDILIIALVILAAMTADFFLRKTDGLLVCDAALGVIITFGMLCHSGILFCTPPLLLMYLKGSVPIRKSVVHASVLGAVFLGGFLTVNLVFGELEPERVLKILDAFKSRYPGIPITISPDSFLFSLFAVTSGGEAYWVEMVRRQTFSYGKIVWFLAAALVPCLIFLCRLIRSGLGAREYFHRNWLVLACTFSSFAPVIMSVFSIDFFRWLVWSFILASYFAMQMTGRTEEKPSSIWGMETGVAGSVLAAAALASVIFYTPARPSEGSSDSQGLLGKNSLEPLVSAVIMRTNAEGFSKNYLYIIANANWNWEFDTRQASGSTSDKVRIRTFSADDGGKDAPSPLDGGCGAEFTAISLSGDRLYLRGWEAFVKRSENGRVSLARPAHGMGFLLRNGNEMLFYPTMPLEQKIGINGKTQNVPFAFDDYLLLKQGWSGSTITVYPSFLNARNRVFYCSNQGKTVKLSSPAGSVSGIPEADKSI